MNKRFVVFLLGTILTVNLITLTMPYVQDVRYLWHTANQLPFSAWLTRYQAPLVHGGFPIGCLPLPSVSSISYLGFGYQLIIDESLEYWDGRSPFVVRFHGATITVRWNGSQLTAASNSGRIVTKIDPHISNGSLVSALVWLIEDNGRYTSTSALLFDACHQAPGFIVPDPSGSRHSWRLER